MKYSGIINCSIVDGEGFRVALYISGCKHHCEGCHNQQTWDFKYGKDFTNEVKEILFNRLDKNFIKGLTLTGGDPLYSSVELYPLLKEFRNRYGDTKDIWLYTGFTMNEILSVEEYKQIIDICDYVVDGKFEITKRNVSLKFRGSDNQIIWEKDGEGNFVKSDLN